MLKTIRDLYSRMRVLCVLGFHKWSYIPNQHGGKPMVRVCVRCGNKQVWDYDTAREHGVIAWITVNQKGNRKC